MVLPYIYTCGRLFPNNLLDDSSEFETVSCSSPSFSLVNPKILDYKSCWFILGLVMILLYFLQEEESYVGIYSHRAGDTILFHHEGGVDIGDVESKVRKQSLKTVLSKRHHVGTAFDYQLFLCRSHRSFFTHQVYCRPVLWKYQLVVQDLKLTKSLLDFFPKSMLEPKCKVQCIGYPTIQPRLCTL